MIPQQIIFIYLALKTFFLAAVHLKKIIFVKWCVAKDAAQEIFQ